MLFMEIVAVAMVVAWLYLRWREERDRREEERARAEREVDALVDLAENGPPGYQEEVKRLLDQIRQKAE